MVKEVMYETCNIIWEMLRSIMLLKLKKEKWQKKLSGILKQMKLILLEPLIRENVFTEKAPRAALFLL